MSIELVFSSLAKPPRDIAMRMQLIMEEGSASGRLYGNVASGGKMMQRIPIRRISSASGPSEARQTIGSNLSRSNAFRILRRQKLAPPIRDM